MKFRGILPIFFVFLLSFGARLYKLDEVPAALYIDEAAFAVNARQILETGRDEFGVTYPLFTKSFHTGKNPAYLYSAVGGTALFGMNAFAERLPAAFFGALETVFLYLIVLEIGAGPVAAFLAALLLGVSPWSFVMSRIGFEPITLSCAFAAAVFCLLRSLRAPRMIVCSSILFALCFYCYAPAFTLVPLTLAGFLALFRAEAAKNARIIALSGLVFIVLLVPQALPGVKGEDQTRHFRESLISHPVNENLNRALLKDSRVFDSEFVIENKTLRTAAVFARNYFSTFGMDYLFRKGDISTSRHHVKGHGVLYPWQLLFIFLGIAFPPIPDKRFRWFLLVWLAAFPVGPSLTAQWAPMITRTIPGAAVFAALTALGVASFLKIVSKSLKILEGVISSGREWALLALTAAMIAAPVFGFFSDYFTKYPVDSADAFYYGAQAAIIDAEKHSDGYDLIVVDETIPFIYIYVLYHAWDKPESFDELELGWNGPYRVGMIGKYLVGPVKPCAKPLKCLYITRLPAPAFATEIRKHGYPKRKKAYILSGYSDLQN